MHKPTFRSTGLPLLLAAAVLVLLNLGLYFRLSAMPATAPRFDLPYSEDFATITRMPYEEFGGDWEIRDEMLVQLSTSGYDLTSYIPIGIPADAPYTFAATLRYLDGTMGGGLLFNTQQTTSRQQSHMARFNVDNGQLWLIYGYFGDDSDFIGQGSMLLESPPQNANPYRLRVQVNDNTYSLYLDDTLLVDEVPLMYSGGAVGFISAISQVAFDDVRIDTQLAANARSQPVVSPPAEDVDAIFADTFDGSGGTSQWRPLSGEWRLVDGALVQQQANGFDLSTVHQQPFNYPLTLRANFTHQEGAGGGVLFNLPQPDSKNGGHMVRYVEDGGIIAWGYFDENGGFNGQGSAQVSQPGDSPHVLTVRISETAYSIALDNVELVTDVAINNPVSPAYIGLTASQSVVAFDEVTVTGGALPAISTANINADAATGDWRTVDGVITQTATEKTDYIAGTGLAGEQFSISVDIALPDDTPDAGAGLVFHMDGRDDRSSGYMVRFSNSGQELFWGRYDADGMFTGEGSVPLNLSEAASHTLLLTVREGSFDIDVNGTAIVESIPHTRDSGWIGLVSFGGPVTFSNVNLQLGE
jgi:hypothetical protein